MLALRTFGLAFGIALVAAVGCGDDPAADDDGSGASGSGAGSSSATSMSTGTSMSTTGAGGSAPLTCSVPFSDIPIGDCDLLAQNCPTGMWCDVIDNGGLVTSCVAHSGGLKGKGEDCTSNAACNAGLMCVGEQCRPPCCPATDEPCDGGDCNLQVDFGGAYAMMCTYAVACTLFAGDCPMGEECHINDADAGLAVCSTPSGSQVDEGGSCTFTNDCKESQHCNDNPPDDGICRHLCDTTIAATAAPSEGGCLPARICDPVNAAGFPNLGICTP